MHLLAVDDDPIILELIQEFVKFLGNHTLETAECAVDAMDIMAREDGPEIDCFLLDIQMPGTDGVELCKIIRSRADHLTTPILMLTAMSDKSYIDRAFSAGADDYITKPFEIDQLRGRIQLLDNSIKQRKAQAQMANAPEGAPASDQASDNADKIMMHEPFSVQDVEGVISHQALENYVTLLSQKQLFGSSVFALSIRGIQDLYEKTCDFEFNCLITDVAEAIASTLEDHQNLISYAGNGVFVCIVERGWQPDPHQITDRINLTLHHMGLCFNDGKPMIVSVSSGKTVRLVWKTGDKAVDALAIAYESAEQESARYARSMDDFWYNRMTA